MNRIKIEVLNKIIETHPQFKNKSLLYDGIVKALDCTLERARELAATHCNMISLYAILTAEGIYFGNYAEYFKWMLEKGFCDVNGYIIADKATILDSLGFKKSLLKYKEIEDIIDPLRLDSGKFYQFKIHGNTKGYHFMAGYIEDGIFKISDTSYRGIGVKAIDHINEKNFCWVMEY